jgi:nitronate monooxygenase
MEQSKTNGTSRRTFVKGGAAIGLAAAAASAKPYEAGAARHDRETKPVLTESSKTLIRQFGLDYPIFQAAPGGAELAFAVAEAGAMGALALTWASPEQAAAGVKLLKTTSKGSFYANYVLHFEPASIDAAIAAGCPCFQFSWGMPSEELVRKIKDAGAQFGIQVSSGQHAQEALRLIPDFLICQGHEAGGHVQGSSPLEAALADVLQVANAVPVLAAGGISTGADVKQLTAMGAAGAVLGTRLMATRESNGHDQYKDSLVKAGKGNSVYTNCFKNGWGATHRVLRNGTFREWEAAGSPLPGKRPGEEEIIAHHPESGAVKRYDIQFPVKGHEGDLNGLALYAGTGVDQIKDVPSVDELIKRIWAEYLHG